VEAVHLSVVPAEIHSLPQRQVPRNTLPGAPGRVKDLHLAFFLIIIIVVVIIIYMYIYI